MKSYGDINKLRRHGMDISQVWNGSGICDFEVKTVTLVLGHGRAALNFRKGIEKRGFII